MRGNAWPTGLDGEALTFLPSLHLGLGNGGVGEGVRSVPEKPQMCPCLGWMLGQTAVAGLFVLQALRIKHT